MVPSSKPPAAFRDSRDDEPRIIPARRPAYVPRVADPRFVLVRSGPADGRYPPSMRRDRARGDATT